MTDHLYFAMLCAFVPTMAFGGLALWAVDSERFRQYRVRTPVLLSRVIEGATVVELSRQEPPRDAPLLELRGPAAFQRDIVASVRVASYGDCHAADVAAFAVGDERVVVPSPPHIHQVIGVVPVKQGPARNGLAPPYPSSGRTDSPAPLRTCTNESQTVRPGRRLWTTRPTDSQHRGRR